ncbi:MAG: hypothetical protein ACI8RD_003172 [Bacillariaceae sp.]|jgi:hypothetical protein
MLHFEAACSALSVCARYLPSTGYTWNFDENDDDDDDDDGDDDDDDEEKDTSNDVDSDIIDPVVSLMKLNKRMKRRKILDNRKAGERNEAEEEGLRASAAIDQILVRLSKNSHVTTASAADDDTDDDDDNNATSTKNIVRGDTIAVAEPSTNI